MFLAFLVIFVPLVIWGITRYRKAKKNSDASFDDNHFSQAGVDIDFAQGTIKLNNQTYDVDQVTGISSERYSTAKYGDRRSFKAIIEVDDLAKPRHEIRLVNQKAAEEFTQRLSVALRKAGGPSFN